MPLPTVACSCDDEAMWSRSGGCSSSLRLSPEASASTAGECRLAPAHRMRWSCAVYLQGCGCAFPACAAMPASQPQQATGSGSRRFPSVGSTGRRVRCAAAAQRSRRRCRRCQRCRATAGRLGAGSCWLLGAQLRTGSTSRDVTDAAHHQPASGGIAVPCLSLRRNVSVPQAAAVRYLQAVCAVADPLLR